MNSSSNAAGDAPAGAADEAAHTIILHVLSPSFDTPNRLTFNDLSIRTTVGTLKDLITQSTPNRPSAAQQRLIYRGRPLLNDNIMLENILEPSDDFTHSLHLVLPPRSVPPGTTSAPAGSSSPIGTSSAIPPSIQQLPPFHLPQTQHPIQTTQTLRYRSPLNRHSSATPPPRTDHPNPILEHLNQELNWLHLANQARLQLSRLQAQEAQLREFLSSTGGRPPTLNNHPVPSPRPVPPSPPPSVNASQSPDPGLPSVSRTPLPPANSAANALRVSANATLQSLEVETRRLRLLSLHQQICIVEEEVGRGHAPRLEIVVALRNQLYWLVDEQHRNLEIPRDGQVEALLSRIMNVYIRGDQLRVLQSRRPIPFQTASPSPALAIPATAYAPQYPVYLLASPVGYHAVLASPAALAAMRPPPPTVPQQLSSIPTIPVPDPALAIPPNPIQPAMENVVRQAVLNRAVHHEQDVVGRNARRVWLFIRLYFFCYLFSESGTWSRFIFVTLALLISLLSETDLPRRLHQVIIDPVQRHLEGLVHAGGDEIVQPARNNGNGAHPQVDGRGNRAFVNGEPVNQAVPAGIQQGLRRVERSIALFIASLVPGVGERHVEVRNAALNAARVREGEEERRNEERVDNPNNGRPEAEGPHINDNHTVAIPRDGNEQN